MESLSSVYKNWSGAKENPVQLVSRRADPSLMSSRDILKIDAKNSFAIVYQYQWKLFRYCMDKHQSFLAKGF